MPDQPSSGWLVLPPMTHGSDMETFTTQDLACTCRIFMDLAYPGAPETIPASKRPYYDIAASRPLHDFLIPAAVAIGICQDLTQLKCDLRGYAFRLGSLEYPHIKLRIQLMDFHQRDIWVYSVDTHDGFHQATKYLSAAETEAWRLLIDRNRQLKFEIEKALEEAGYLTPKNLLQLDLTSPSNPV